MSVSYNNSLGHCLPSKAAIQNILLLLFGDLPYLELKHIFDEHILT